MSGYDILVYIIIPIGVTILTTAIIALTKLVSTKLISNRLIVKEITKISDKDINQFIDLYNQRISSDIRICAEQIVDFSSFGGNTDIKHHLYVCKDKDNVVAFVKLMTSTSKKYVFIAYIAIDDTDLLAIRSGVNLLINHTIKKHIKKENNIQEIEFLLEQQCAIIPIEVKSKKGETRSLNEFLKEWKPPYAYKLTNTNIGQVDTKITIPHYMAIFL